MKFLSLTKRRSVWFGIFSLLLLFIVFFSINIKTSKALLGFGGMVGGVISCVDEGSIAIVVGPLPNRPAGIYLYNFPGTVGLQYFKFFSPGAWVLGGYVPAPGIPCSNGGIPVAFPIGIIEYVGSSMAPL